MQHVAAPSINGDMPDDRSPYELIKDKTEFAHTDEQATNRAT